MPPSVAGYCKSAPKIGVAAASNFAGSPTTIRIPNGAARVFSTSMVCGWQSCATKNDCAFPGCTLWNMVIASAAAVPSSSSEALATGRPVRSSIICW